MPAWAKSKTPVSKNGRAKSAGDVAQVVECLPSKCEALSSNPTKIIILILIVIMTPKV
jgi:hypothetical protein